MIISNHRLQNEKTHGAGPSLLQSCPPWLTKLAGYKEYRWLPEKVCRLSRSSRLVHTLAPKKEAGDSGRVAAPVI